MARRHRLPSELYDPIDIAGQSVEQYGLYSDSLENHGPSSLRVHPPRAAPFPVAHGKYVSGQLVWEVACRCN